MERLAKVRHDKLLTGFGWVVSLLGTSRCVRRSRIAQYLFNSAALWDNKSWRERWAAAKARVEDRVVLSVLPRIYRLLGNIGHGTVVASSYS